MLQLYISRVGGLAEGRMSKASAGARPKTPKKGLKRELKVSKKAE
jgi:hypothetical protein